MVKHLRSALLLFLLITLLIPSIPILPHGRAAAAVAPRSKFWRLRTAAAPIWPLPVLEQATLWTR